MGKRPAFSILAFFISAVPITSGFGAGPVGSKLLKASAVAPVRTSNAAGTARQTPLGDGFILTGVNGTVSSPDSNESHYRWFFEFDSDISDDKGRVDAGTGLELLPSATLEKMTTDVEKRSNANYRLWGRVTRYKGKNFIFPTYFLPLGKTNKPQSKQSQGTQQQEFKPAINEPNDALTVPREIIEKLKARKIVRPAQLRKGLELERDSVLVDRTALLVRQARKDVRAQEPRTISNLCAYDLFVLDALGQNVQQVSFGLLPCEALERAEQQQSAEPDTLRFKIAGIVTKYKGRQYLLLHRARRVYSHGNFGR